MEQYRVPPDTHIGHVHLKVSDLEQSIRFYCEVLGFDFVMRYGDSAAFVSAGGYHHHIGLNTWHSLHAPPASPNGVGLYHAAIVYPTRKDLALILRRLMDHEVPLTGAADHGVSEALYLNDPDSNGLELYWDRPRAAWPRDEKGNLTMFTRPLDLNNLLGEIHA